MGDEKDQGRGEEEAPPSTDMSDKNDTLCGVPRKVFFCLIVSLICAIAIGVGVGVTAGEQSKGGNCEMSKATDTKLSDTELLASIVLPCVDIATLEESSPQYRSLEWLAYEDSRNLNIDDDATELIERFSLVTLYFATGGENWIVHDPNRIYWMNDSSHCDWYGIDCDENGSVTDLYLYDNVLSGTLPPEIGNLQNARHIDMDSNNFEGSIPSEIGNLQQLLDLSLWGNSFSGTIPTEIGNLQQLTLLRLWDNLFSGTIPSEIGNLQQLAGLGLSGNTFSGTIPSEIGNLQQLTGLSLNENSLSGTVPSEIGNLQQLVGFYLSKNSFSGTIPSEIGNLQQLTELGLSRNVGLTGTLPVEFGQLESIREAYLQNTSLTGGLDDLAFCKNRDLYYFIFYADCRGLNAEIFCVCCTMCCYMDGDNCIYLGY
eukprot:scaffold2203_cov106-Cylindrotheca_fusiformis.AAC.3